MDKESLSEKRGYKENFTVSLAVACFLIFAWLLYVYMNQTWIVAFQQVVSWLTNPVINYTPVHVKGADLAFIATAEMLILGVISSCTLLNEETDLLLKCLCTFGFGIGLTGLMVIVLSIFGSLYKLHLNVAILCLCVAFLLVNIRNKKLKKERIVSNFVSAPSAFNIRKRLASLKVWLPSFFAMGIIFFFCFYHALLTVITHWDAIVYHAVMSIFMYRYHAIPLIAGPSIGIQMSANFPPLFSALGAYYYIQIGEIEDFYLRAISPFSGLFAVLATYKIGEILLGKKYGIISSLLLSMTPIFFRYSMYATCYSTLVFFSTASVLFLLLGITKVKSEKYWVISGIFYGFALLTSYLALYLAPFFLISLIYLFTKDGKRCMKLHVKRALLLFSSALIIGGVWYLRNWILLGNPVYPNAYKIFGGINIDPLIIETTFKGIKWSATYSFFGWDRPLPEKIAILLIYRTHFPAISLFTILGIIFLPVRDKRFLLLLLWPLTLISFILSGITWSFPRHIVITTPGFALISSLPIVKILEKCERFDKKIDAQPRGKMLIAHRYKSNLLKLIIGIVLTLSFLFPSLTLCMGGKVWGENFFDTPSGDYLWLLKNPNAEKWSVLFHLYQEAVAWKWLDEHLKVGEKFATIENRIYYIKNCSNDYFFYLDGWEARELYHITDPEAILQFLQIRNVKYVLDVAWARTHGHFDILPMAKYLDSPYFPVIMDRGGNPNIYNVGPIKTPIIANSPVLLSISQEGWSELEIRNGKLTQSVIAGTNSARLYVSTLNQTIIVKITYLDDGKDKLSIHLYDPCQKTWYYNYTIIQKNDTKKWCVYEFSIPPNDMGFVKLSLHAYYENFIVARIEATTT